VKKYKTQWVLYPVEFVAGALILVGMAVVGLVRSVTLLPDWRRYKRIREI